MKKSTNKPVEKSTKAKSCGCIENINKSLEEMGSNTRLCADNFINLKTGKFSKAKVRLFVEKDNSRKREPLKRIIPIYCPFCGQKY